MAVAGSIDRLQKECSRHGPMGPFEFVWSAVDFQLPKLRVGRAAVESLEEIPRKSLEESSEISPYLKFPHLTATVLNLETDLRGTILLFNFP